MLKLPHKSYFGHIIKKLETQAFLEGKMGVRIKTAKNMIV
jgi:hypothetical protein